MARPPNPHPTDGELEILQVLWREGPSTLGVIREALQEQRDVATTTVATMLKVMLEKGLVARRQGERGYEWRARRNQARTQAGLLRKLVDRAFEGSTGGAVLRLMEEGTLDADDRDAIRRLLDDAEGRDG